jgi:hypothetical protein
VADLKSIADLLRGEDEAQAKLRTATEGLTTATNNAINAQVALTNAINNLLPQINVAVSVPAGSAVNSNAPLVYS